MGRTRISNSDLLWIFHEKLREYEDHPFHGVLLAIIPEDKGNWTVVVSQRLPKREPDLAERIGKIEKQLRKQYTLDA